MATQEEILSQIQELKAKRAAILAQGTDEPPETFLGNVFNWENTKQAGSNIVTGLGKMGEILYDSAKHPVDSAQALGNAALEGIKDPIGSMQQGAVDVVSTIPGLNVGAEYLAEQNALGDYSPDQQRALEESGAVTSPAEWGRRVNEEAVDAAVPAIAGRVAKTAARVAVARGGAVGRAIQAFFPDSVINKISKDPDAIAKHHGVGISNTPGEREFFRDLADGAKEWAKSKLAVGVKTWDEYEQRIGDFLTGKAKFREEMVNQADDVFSKNGIVIGGGGVSGPRHGLHVQPIDDALDSQWKKLEQDKSSAYSKLAANDRELLKDQLAADFKDPTTGLDLSVTPKLLFDKLQTTYRKLRELRAYDDTAQGMLPRNAGQAGGLALQIGEDQLGGIANIAIQREVLSAYARGLKNSLNDVMERAVKMYPSSFKGIKPKDFSEAGDAYHALSAYADAVERQKNVLGAVKGPGNPNSLLTAAQPGILRKAGEIVGDVTGVTDYSERYNTLKALDLPDERMSAVNQIGRAASGQAISPGMNAVATAGSSATLAAARLDDMLLLEKDPDQLRQAVAQSDMPEEAKQALISAAHAPQSVKRSALGAAKMAAIEAGVSSFEPSPIPGYNSYIRAEKEGGYITDMSERIMFGNEINRMFLRSDPRKALELTQRLAEDGYVPYVPEEFKMQSRTPEPVITPPSAPQIRSQVSNRLSETTETDVGTRTDPGY